MIAIQDPEKKVMYWGFRLLALTIPVLTTSYFSYRSAKVESETKAAAIASGGYNTTKEVIEDIQIQLKAQSASLATLQGQVETLQAMVLAHHDHGQGHYSPTAMPSPSPQPHVASAETFVAKPVPAPAAMSAIVNFLAPVSDAGIQNPSAAVGVYKPKSMPKDLETALKAQDISL